MANQKFWLLLEKNQKSFDGITLRRAKSKILKAVLDMAIMNEMTKRKIISVPGAITFIEKRYGIYINPGTIYPIFNKLEKQGCIARLPNRLPRLYFITATGECILRNVQQSSAEIADFVLELVDTGKLTN